MKKKKGMIIIIGIPGAGKSTLVEQLFPLHECVSLDALPERGQNSEDKLLFKLCERGANIVIDKANIDKITRIRYINMAKEHNYDSIQAVILDTSYDAACARNATRKRHVPPGVIKDYAQKFEWPKIEEGYTSEPWTVWNNWDPRRGQ